MAAGSEVTLLEAKGLGRRFGDRWIFRRLEIELRPGQALAVTGPNGQGKSTLLKALAGLIEVSEGEVLRTERFGYAALDQNLYPNLSCAEHLAFAGGSVQALERAGMAGMADQMAGRLSTGQRVRLKLALALARDPLLLLLDEPRAALDEAGRSLIDQVVRDQTAKGAVVLATNDPADVKLATHELRLA